MAPVPLDCPGSWLPVSHLKPGDKIRWPVYERPVYLSEPQMPGTPGPWEGSKAARVQVDWTGERKPAQ